MIRMFDGNPSKATSAPPLSLHHRIVLSIMMFLQFAIWGSWVIVYYPFLLNKGFTGVQATSITANMYLGAIISTLFAGYLADRWMNSERLMGICHILGAGLLYAMSQITSPDQYWTLFTITFAYSLVFNPTLSVINSLTFRNVPDGERDFPGLRVLGTIGWICAGFLVDFVCSGKVAGKDGEMIPNTIATSGPLFQAAIISLIFGFYCLFLLPKTPPVGKSGGALDFLRALAMLKDFSFAVFFVITLIASIAMGMYFNSAGDFLDRGAGVDQVGSTLAIGQMVELLLLVLLPFFLKRFGIKAVMAVGLFCWALRYLFFAHGGDSGLPLALAIAGVALHGFCFDFFFAAGFIHVDKTAPKDLRASAQSLLGVLVYGLGTWLGTLVSGILTERNKIVDGDQTSMDWFGFWITPSVVLFVALAFFLVLFKAKEEPISV
jgi:nucleoside transporter